MYAKFKLIEDAIPLAKKFNNILFDLNKTRVAYAPSTFKYLKETDMSEMVLFYESCLWESYLHNVIKRLNMWIEILDKYLSEFGGNWKDWATTELIRLVSNYGEDDDYNTDGSIKLDDDKLISFSVIRYMVSEGWDDIVQDTNVSDLMNLCNAIKVSSFSIKEMIKGSMGIDIDMYKKVYDEDEEGNVDGEYEMVKMGFADEVIDKIERKDNAESDGNIIIQTCLHIRLIIHKLSELDKRKDNANELAKIRKDIGNILDLRFEDIDVDTSKAPF